MKGLFLSAALFGLVPFCGFADPVIDVLSQVVSGPGSSGTVPIEITGLSSPLAAFDLVVQFDPSVIQLTDVRFPTSSTILGAPDHSLFTVSGSTLVGNSFGGSDAFTAASFVNSGTAVDVSDVSTLLDLSSQPSTFTMVFLDFTALVPGTSPLTITSELLSDSAGGSISATINNGTFRATPEPGSVILLGACLGAISVNLLRKRLPPRTRRAIWRRLA